MKHIVCSHSSYLSLRLAIIHKLEMNDHIFTFPDTIRFDASCPMAISHVDRVFLHIVDVTVAIEDVFASTQVDLVVG